MHESHKSPKLVFMETYIYQLETMSPAPALSSSLPVDGEASSSPHQTHKGKRKGSGKRGGTIKLSTEPQSIAARQRRHRISDRFKILKSLVPGGSKMDTVSMLEEAIHYVKFLKTQIWLHQAALMTPPFPSSCSCNTTVITNGTTDVYTTIDTSSPVLTSNHQIVSYSLPPPSSPLPPLPFKGEEEMLSYVGLNY